MDQPDSLQARFLYRPVYFHPKKRACNRQVIQTLDCTGSVKADQIIALFVRLFAIAIVLFSIRQLATTVTYYQEWGSPFALWITGLTLFVLFLVAAILWKFPLTVAKKIYVQDSDPESATQWNVESLYELGFVLIGIYIVYTAATALLYWWLYSVLASEAFENRSIFNVDNKASIILSVVEFGIGMWLIFGATGLFMPLPATK